MDSDADVINKLDDIIENIQKTPMVLDKIRYYSELVNRQDNPDKLSHNVEL